MNCSLLHTQPSAALKSAYRSFPIPSPLSRFIDSCEGYVETSTPMSNRTSKNQRKRCSLILSTVTVLLSTTASLTWSCGLGNDAEPPPIPKLRGHHLIWKKKLPITGQSVRTPALSGPSSDYVLLVSGRVDTGRYGEKLTAEHRTDQAGQYRLPHDHLKLSPPGLVSTHRDRTHHEYLYEWDEKKPLKGERVTIQFQGLAYRFRISPERLEEVSRSSLEVSVWKRGEPPGTPLLIYILFGGVVLLFLALFFFRRWLLSRQKKSSKRH